MPRSRRIQTVRCGRFGNDADSFKIDRPIKSIGRAFTQSRRASLGTARLPPAREAAVALGQRARSQGGSAAACTPHGVLHRHTTYFKRHTKGEPFQIDPVSMCQ